MSVFEPDIINGSIGSSAVGDQVLAERRLMVAILADALDCYRKYMMTSNVRRRKLFRDADRWIHSEEYWVFSFRNICEVLGLDPQALREQARRWRRRQITSMIEPVPLQASGSTFSLS
ncbi:MAG: hypothetical protein HY270_24225 [Deltaproteobacteria bacterium]|nr:hypothetical protein [Deltaproteobacteria bacterium]